MEDRLQLYKKVEWSRKIANATTSQIWNAQEQLWLFNFNRQFHWTVVNASDVNNPVRHGVYFDWEDVRRMLAGRFLLTVDAEPDWDMSVD